EAPEDRRQQLRVARRRREGVEVRERRRRRGEAVAAQARVMPLRSGAGGGEKRRQIDRARQMADSPVSPVPVRTPSSVGSAKTLPSPIEPVSAAPPTVHPTFSTR